MGVGKYSVLICDKAGQPHHWACWEDAITLKFKELISYEMGGISTFRGGVSRSTGLRTEMDVSPIIFLKEVLNYDARVPSLTNNNLFKRDLHICAYCGRHYKEEKLSRDHVIPVSRGGENTWKNCVTSCKSCNHTKANNLLSDIDMKLLYIPYIPSNVEKLLLQNRNVLADQMEYLRVMLPEHSRIKYMDKIMRLDIH